MAKYKKKDKSSSEFDFMLDTNSRLVLETVYRERQISRADLARVTRFQPSTITLVVASLIKKGWLIEDDEAIKTPPTSAGGRPAKMVRINGRARLVLAIDVEPERLRLALVGLDLETVSYYEREISRFDSPESIITKIFEGCENLMSVNSAWREKIVGIGLNVPGEVNVQEGISIGSTNMPHWKNVPIVQILKDKFNLPVKIENSIHLAALAEKRRRPEIEDRNVLCLSLRTGVGIAFLFKGSLYCGASHQDGEIGHTVVDINGKLCECGRKGCLETFISSSAICHYANEEINAGHCKKLLQCVNNNIEQITPELIYRLAKEGDNDCREIVKKIAFYLGLGVANLIQVLNPHELVICGSIDIAEEFFLDRLNEVFDQVLLPQTRNDIKIILSPYKDRAALFGAAALIIENVFNPTT